MPTILLLALCIVLFIQLVYYWGIFSRFSFAKPIVNGEYTLPVSVLICAKNEAENPREKPTIYTRTRISEFSNRTDKRRLHR